MAELILDQKVLGDVTELNLGFLRLLTEAASACREDSAGVLGLPLPLASELGRISNQRQLEMARCPYTLFSIRPEDAAFWTAVRGGRVPLSYRRALAAPAVPVSGFLLTALMYGRNLTANDQRFAARLALGVSASGNRAMDSISPVLLKEVAYGAPGLLTARFADNPRFWPDLIRTARRGTALQRHAARMLGLQLVIPVEKEPPG